MTGRFWPIDDRLRHWQPVVPENRVTGKPMPIQCCGVPIVAAVAKGIEAPLQLVVDNMTELEHTGTVHKQLAIGIGDYDTVETRCRHDDDAVTIFYRRRQRPLPWHLSLLMGLRPGDVYVQTASVSFTPPCAWYQIHWTAVVATRKLMARHYAPTRDRAPVDCDLEPAAIPRAIARDARL